MNDKHIELLIINPQLDYCDPEGPLYVAGADNAMRNVAHLVNQVGSRLTDINVTLDSHHLIDVAHPIFWRDANSNNPPPFTVIQDTDIAQGKWLPVLPILTRRMLHYAKELSVECRHMLIILPPHCLIGTRGHNVVPELMAALLEWERKQFALINYITYGSNPFVEQYSVIRAEVPDLCDTTTCDNVLLVRKLTECDELLLTGGPNWDRLAYSIRDIIRLCEDRSFVRKMVLLIDTVCQMKFSSDPQTKSVDIASCAKAMGIRVATTADYSG